MTRTVHNETEESGGVPDNIQITSLENPNGAIEVRSDFDMDSNAIENVKWLVIESPHLQNIATITGAQLLTSPAVCYNDDATVLLTLPTMADLVAAGMKRGMEFYLHIVIHQGMVIINIAMP